MISPEYLASAYARNVYIVKQQTDGLSHADSLVQLPFRANCLNWVVGHLVTNRNSVLKLLGTDPALDEERAARYAYESESVTGQGPGVLPLEELIAILERSQERIANILANITPGELSRQVVFFGDQPMSVAEWLVYFFFHDCYHTGQTEILRQAAGKNDKII